MSYSFSVRGKTKDEVKDKISQELVKVVENQPLHKADTSQALAAAKNFIHVLADDPLKDILVSVSGYLSWIDSQSETFTGINFSISAQLVAKE